MVNTSAIWQQAAHTTYQLSSLSCSTRTIQKSLTLNEKEFSGEKKKKAGEWTNSRKMTRQKLRGLGRTTREEIGKGNQMTALRFQMGETADIPGLPSCNNKMTRNHTSSSFFFSFSFFQIKLIGGYWVCIQHVSSRSASRTLQYTRTGARS